jgi:hypothetical protein
MKRLLRALAALGAALAGLAALILGARAVRALVARLGTVEGEGDAFLPAPDGKAVLVHLPGDSAPTRVELPPEITAAEVKAVRIVPGGELVVMVRHHGIDRRAMLGGKDPA